MQLSPEGLKFIQQFEGFSAVPYVCPAGYWTVGYGHVLDVTKSDEMSRESQSQPFSANAPEGAITPAQALALLQQDVRIAAQSVARLITAKLNQNQFDALVSFTYNLGAAALQRSTLRQVINRGEHAAAPHEFMRWVWAAGHKLPGLIRRRAAEAALYRAAESA